MEYVSQKKKTSPYRLTKTAPEHSAKKDDMESFFLMLY